MKITQLSENIIYRHKGVAIYLELNYVNGKVSLIEEEGAIKEWIFAGRGRNYLGGWLIVLEAMQEAIKYADIRLKEQAEARAKATEEELFELAQTVSEYDSL